MKKCIDCKLSEPTVTFRVIKGYARNTCNRCVTNEILNKRKTKEGLLGNIYSCQITTSKARGYPKPEYTREEFIKAISDMPLFDKLFNAWETSGFLKPLRPSIDRNNDNIPYTKNNIALMTWEENRKKSYIDIKEGRNNKKSVAILQFTKEGKYIQEFYSISEAARRIGLNQSSSISECLKGKNKTAGGYVWKRK